ncbi:hypothetical protein V1478_015283, partial [Vespula squamosa]
MGLNIRSDSKRRVAATALACVTRTDASPEQEEQPVGREKERKRGSVQGVDGGAMHAIYQHRTDNEVPRRLPVVKDNNNDDDDDDRSAGVTLDVAQTAIQSPLFSLGSFRFEAYGGAYWNEGPTKRGNYRACPPASGSSTIY